MFELWNVTNNNGDLPNRPRAFISHYTSIQQAVDYENEFEKILDRVKGTYNDRKTVLLDELAKASEKLKKIFAMRTECTKILINPFVRMNTFRDKIETLTEDVNAKFIREFFGDSTKYEIMKKLYIIVWFYLELHRLFDFRLTDDEANTLTIGDVVKGTQKYNSKLLEELWPDFKGIWRKVVDYVKPRECVNANEFEGMLALIDDENSPFVGSLLSIYGEDGEIYRAISDGISKLQDNILDMRNKDLNPNEFGYDDTESGDLPLESLTKDDMTHLITGENYEGEIELIVFTHMHIDSGLRRESVTYDYAGIARDLMCRYTSGRLHLRTGKHMTIRRECNFSYDSELDSNSNEESEEDRIARKRRELMDSFRPLHGVESLRAYMDKVDKIGRNKFKSFNNESKVNSTIDRIVTTTKSTIDEIEIKYIRIAEILATILRYVVSIEKSQKEIEAISKSTIGKVFEEKVCGYSVPDDLRLMDEWPVKSLLSISEYLLNVVNEKKYIFKKGIRSSYSQHISSREKNKLDSYRETIIWNKDDKEDVLAAKKAAAPAKVSLLEKLFQAMNNSRGLLKEVSVSLKKTFLPVIKDLIQDGRGEKEGELLQSISSKYFVDFIAWLNKLISDLHWELSKEAGETAKHEVGSESKKEQEEKEKMAEKEKNVYHEFIPPKPTILKGDINRVEVPYNEKISDYIIKFGFKLCEVDVLDAKTKMEVTEEERRKNYDKHKVLLVLKKK